MISTKYLCCNEFLCQPEETYPGKRRKELSGGICSKNKFFNMPSLIFQFTEAVRHFSVLGIVVDTSIDILSKLLEGLNFSRCQKTFLPATRFRLIKNFSLQTTDRLD